MIDPNALRFMREQRKYLASILFAFKFVANTLNTLLWTQMSTPVLFFARNSPENTW